MAAWLTPVAGLRGGRADEQPGGGRQLQTLLGLNLDEIAVVLRNEDRLAEIKLAYHQESTGDEDRRKLLVESLGLQEELRATVQAKREAIESFLTDLDARIARTRGLL